MTHLLTPYQCAGCQSPFVEKLPDIFLYTCPHCLTENRCVNGSAIKRDTGTKPSEDLSPLEIGLTCRWENVAYEIIGRIRFVYEEGYYRNQWLLMGENEQYKWLLESYATYAIVNYSAVEINHQLFKNKEPGNLIEMSGNTTFCLDSIAEIDHMIREGYTPLLVDMSKGVLSIDMSGLKLEWAVVDLVPKQKAEVYYGQIVELEELNFNKFRALNG